LITAGWSVKSQRNMAIFSSSSAMHSGEEKRLRTNGIGSQLASDQSMPLSRRSHCQSPSFQPKVATSGPGNPTFFAMASASFGFLRCA
jgi:hypothetical protein